MGSRVARVATWMAVACLVILVGVPLVGAQQAGLANPGFESGVIAPWVAGYGPQGVSVVGAEDVPGTVFGDGTVHLTPREGTKMARLGQSSWGQPDGINELYQGFTIAQPTVGFSYKWCTYDSEPNDWFDVKLTVLSDPPVDVFYFSSTAPAARADYSLWCSEWQDQTVQVGDHVGKQARLYASAGGNRNGTAATWAYLDAPASAPVPTPAPAAGPATVDVKPDSIHVKDNENGNGALNVFVELPAGQNVANISAASVTLKVNGVSLNPLAQPVLGDYDADGVADAGFRFSRAAVIAALGAAEGNAAFTLSGQVSSGVAFSGTDSVTVVVRAKPLPAAARSLPKKM